MGYRTPLHEHGHGHQDKATWCFDAFHDQVVTEVDRKAQEIILNALKPTFELYDLGLLTEESEDDNSRFQKDYFWCIDPLDGTLSFIESSPGYSVSIALVSRNGVPQLGVIYDPLEKVLYHAMIGQGAFRNGIRMDLLASEKRNQFTMFSDRSFLDHPKFKLIYSECIALSRKLGFDKFELVKHGGGAMNATWVLENTPACYFKFPKKTDGGGSLWDYAASAIIATEAGAHVSDIHGNPPDLNRSASTFMNQRGILYASNAEIAHSIMDIYKKLAE